MRASRDEILQFLRRTPNAKESWVNVLYAAGVPMEGVDRFVQTMAMVPDSPLRMAEDTMLSKEIVKLNGVFGELRDGGKGNGRPVVKIHVVMDYAMRLRLTALTQGFCQVQVENGNRFRRTSHTIAHAIRRVTGAYNFMKLPPGASICEVGADVKNWLVNDMIPGPGDEVSGGYTSARPVITQRDVIRASWEELAKRIARPEYGASPLSKAKAEAALDDGDRIFQNQLIQNMSGSNRYIISNDSNYDIKFGDMPRVMMAMGSVAWYGTMLRIKGLSRQTRIREGTLDGVGVNYRVDWKNNRIDFRNPNCTAFGYSHDVMELMKYEECNGYVWHSSDANYVYAKGAETNDELLFFSVVRVPKAIYLVQPNFVEHPNAGQLEVNSIWAVGGWSGGKALEFQPVKFHVDELAFSKIFEKRRALDYKGDFTQTLTLVRSTNVRMWLNGSPIGVDQKIATSLAEATAVVIETMVSQSRLLTNYSFEKVMKKYEISMARGTWFYRMMENVVDVRVAFGKVAGPITKGWASVRAGMLDLALRPVSDIRVSVHRVGSHCRLEDMGKPEYIGVDCVGIKEDEDVFTEGVSGLSMDDSDSSNPASSETEVESVATSASSWVEPVQTKAVEVRSGWRVQAHEQRVERKAMEEMVELELYLKRAAITEIRIDAGRIARSACRNSIEVMRYNTARTQHVLLRFQAGRMVERMGSEVKGVSAIYDVMNDRFVKTRVTGSVIRADVNDGWYYASSGMRVWNTDEIVDAVEYALDYGHVRDYRALTSVTLGVPGAGKTYGMMKSIAEEFLTTGVRFLVLCVTGKAADEAKKDGLKFGLSKQLMDARVKTVDSYLMNDKSPTEWLCVDEFPMTHYARIDAASSIADPKRINVFGDGRQIPYDPFTAEFDVKYGTLAGSVDESRVTFLHETHRGSEDFCAAWVDVYPKIVPCKCCRKDTRAEPTMFWRRIGGVDDVRFQKGVRYHAYTRNERDDLVQGLRLEEDECGFKKMTNSGIGTVHEDQGSTHQHVQTVRLKADYDPKASSMSPSLYNRLNYVLTDMTRHVKRFDYATSSQERDMVIRRVEVSRDAKRLALVRSGCGMGLTTIMDMLNNVYHPDILSGRSLCM